MPEQKASANILLVDDDPVQVQIREAILRDAGFNITIATSAEAALALLCAPNEGPKIDAVVTDHVLPGASGADFVRDMRRSNPSMPVIVLTGMLTAEAEYCDSDVTFRAKPVPPAELIQVLRAALAQRGRRE